MTTAKPLTAERLRAGLVPKAESLTQFKSFFKSVAHNFCGELQAFNTAPVKCSIAGYTIETLSAAQQVHHHFRFASGVRPLRIWADADRPFDYLIGELTLGGNGIASVESDGQRPPSKFERNLKEAVLKTLVFTIPAAANLTHHVVLEEAKAETEQRALDEPPAETCACLRLLLNAFSMAGEVLIYFRLEDLPLVLGVVVQPDADKAPTARTVMDDCPFEVTAFLKPQLFPLDKVLGMKPGEIFPLSIGTSSPILINFEDRFICEGAMNFNKDSIDIVVLDDAADETIEPV